MPGHSSYSKKPECRPLSQEKDPGIDSPQCPRCSVQTACSSLARALLFGLPWWDLGRESLHPFGASPVPPATPPPRSKASLCHEFSRVIGREFFHLEAAVESDRHSTDIGELMASGRMFGTWWCWGVFCFCFFVVFLKKKILWCLLYSSLSRSPFSPPSSYPLLLPFMFLHLATFLTVMTWLKSKYKLSVLFPAPNVLATKNAI